MNEQAEAARTAETAVIPGDGQANAEEAKAAEVGQASAPNTETTQEARPAEDETATKTDGESAAKSDAATDPEKNAEPDLKTRVADLEHQLVQRTAEAAALALGIPEKRLKHVAQLAALDGIDVSAADAGVKIREAVKAVLTDVPEFISASAAGTGSPGAFPRKTTDEKSPFQRGFEQG